MTWGAPWMITSIRSQLSRRLTKSKEISRSTYQWRAGRIEISAFLDFSHHVLSILHLLLISSNKCWSIYSPVWSELINLDKKGIASQITVVLDSSLTIDKSSVSKKSQNYKSGTNLHNRVSSSLINTSYLSLQENHC